MHLLKGLLRLLHNRWIYIKGKPNSLGPNRRWLARTVVGEGTIFTIDNLFPPVISSLSIKTMKRERRSSSEFVTTERKIIASIVSVSPTERIRSSHLQPHDKRDRRKVSTDGRHVRAWLWSIRSMIGVFSSPLSLSSLNRMNALQRIVTSPAGPLSIYSYPGQFLVDPG